MTTATDVTAALISDLNHAVGADRVRAEPTELGLYRRDASMITGEAAVVCFPTTTKEVAAVVRVWRGHPGRQRGAGGGRHHQDESHPRGRRRPASGLGPTRRAQPRPVPGRRPP